jgi:hypothetical protein
MGVLYPLVARARALAEVDSVLADARAGRGALVAVTGEPGIGKTRLAEAAADRSRAGPAGVFEVIWTWCPSAVGGAPLHPWSRVVRILANGHAAAARLADGSPFLAAVARRAGTPDPAPAGGPPDPEGARSQLAFDVAEVIAAAARPVLVVIDDAHQADTSSLRLLTELAPALRAMPAVVLVTVRDGDQAWRGRLDERDALLRSGPGRVTRRRADPTPTGFVFEFEFEFEERWDNDGQEWYAREMMRIEVAEGQVSDVTVSCTGDWDQARQANHAAAVTLIRP